MRWLAPLGGLGLVLAVVAVPQAGRAQVPVVVEYFTSQGCATCPPADEIFSDLAGEPDVIALALHVDYWDYTGWKDTFGKPEHSERQRAYAKANRERTIYTPQMIVQGADLLVGHEEEAIRGRIAAHRANPAGVGVQLSRADGIVMEIVLTPQDGPVGAADVHVVEYLPEATVTVEGGENAGYHHTFANIVTDWSTIDGWDGSAAVTLRYQRRGAPNVVVLVQAPDNGRILAAARLF